MALDGLAAASAPLIAHEQAPLDAALLEQGRNRLSADAQHAPNVRHGEHPFVVAVEVDGAFSQVLV
jgi:hypothetical protein